MMLLRRRPASSTAAFYEGVPVVNLLTPQRKHDFALFGAAGWAIAIRLLLVAWMVGGAVVYVLSAHET